MKILVAGLVKNHQLARLREEAEKRGHTVDGCYASDLMIEAGTDSFAPRVRGKTLESYDLIYLWAVGKRRWEWYTACLYLAKKHSPAKKHNPAKKHSPAKKHKTIIVNRKAVEPDYHYYLSPAADYLRQTENKLPYPRSTIVFSSKGLKEVLAGYDLPLIVKVSDGRQGRGVYKAETYEKLKQVVDQITKEGGACVIREFIPNNGDIRVFTVGYKAIGAMARTPKESDFRSNISQGGGGAKYNLGSNLRVREIAEKASKVTRTEIAGVDIMISEKDGKPYILEVNPGPQFTGFEKYTGINAAARIVEYFKALYNNTASTH